MSNSGSNFESLLPASVTRNIPKLVEAGEIEGNYSPNCEKGNIFEIVAKGKVTVKLPTNVPSLVYYIELILIENSSGSHEFVIEGYTIIGAAPKFNEAKNAVNVLQAFTTNGGSSWKLIGLQEGEKGAAGEKGATGPESFVGSKLLFPTKIKTFKNTSESTTEEKPAVAESATRAIFGGQTIELVSGTPQFVAIPVQSGKVVTGLAIAINTTEETPANRTHLWVALLNSKFERLKVSSDYTSSTNTPMETSKIRAIKYESTYTAAENEILYGMVCEVMSSSKPLTLIQRETAQFLTFAEPMISGKGPSGLTTPGTLVEKPVASESGKAIWAAFV